MAMREIISWLLVPMFLGAFAVLVYDLAVSSLRKFGVTRRRGFVTRFADWSLRKVFPRVDWPDDYGEYRGKKWQELSK